MSRLIKDTDIIAALEKWEAKIPPFRTMPHHQDIVNAAIRDIFKKAVEIIESQPTAYDVEAVVRELEENQEGFFIRGHMFVRTIPLEKAIEIVRRGGRDEG